MSAVGKTKQGRDGGGGARDGVGHLLCNLKQGHQGLSHSEGDV